MSGANASATPRSHQEMSEANASATPRSHQEMRHVRLWLILGFAGSFVFTPTILPKSFPPRDLAGVWIGKRDTTQVVKKIFPPPMTPWAQARFDAAVPTLGPRVIAGKE